MNANHLRRFVLLVAFACGAWSVTLIASGQEPTPITPGDGVIKLFNGRDLSGLYTWLADTKYEDPHGVFTVRDGMLLISGETIGGITTKNAYRNYHLICEFRWGTRTWAGRKNRTKDSGLLVHGTGPDGAYGGVWQESFEAQIIEGGTGDIIVVKGKGKVPLSLAAEVGRDRDGEAIWKKGAPRKTFKGGRINWFGRDPDWQDVLGFRGSQDVERPGSAWNRMDVICDGALLRILVNGVLVNEAFDLFPTAGQITIQSEGAEILIRRWELWPLGKAPKPAPPPT